MTAPEPPYVELVTRDGLDRRLGEIQGDIEGARDAALAAAENVAGLSATVNEELAKASAARLEIEESLPAVQAAAAMAPTVLEAGDAAPTVLQALSHAQTILATDAYISGAPFTGVTVVDSQNVTVTGMDLTAAGTLAVIATTTTDEGLALSGFDMRSAT